MMYMLILINWMLDVLQNIPAQWQLSTFECMTYNSMKTIFTVTISCQFFTFSMEAMPQLFDRQLLALTNT